jgi:hypothetical protein
MTFDLPALNGGDIGAETIDGTKECDRDEEDGQGVDDDQYEEMDKLPGRRA